MRSVERDTVKEIEKLKDAVHQLYLTVDKIRDTVIDYYQILNTILRNAGIVVYDNKVNKEDLDLVRIMNMVSSYHNVWKPRAILHYKHNNTEFDFIVFGKTYSRDWKRVINVELKATDFTKAVSQASYRQDYVHYSYVAIDLPPKEIIRLFWDELAYCREQGIGVITLHPYPDLLLKAKFNKPKEDLFDELVSTWDERAGSQTRIIEFVKESERDVI